MKFYLSLGGALGFLLAFSGSLNAGNGLAITVRDAAFGCLAGALLLKGFRIVMISNVKRMAARRGDPSPKAANGALNGAGTGGR